MSDSPRPDSYCRTLWQRKQVRGSKRVKAKAPFVEWENPNNAAAEEKFDSTVKESMESNDRARGNRFKPKNPYSRFVQDFELSSQENLGRGFSAQDDMPFDEIVFREKPFATVVERSTDCIFCATCHATKSNFFISCEVREIVFFCCPACKDENQTHRYSCGTFFEEIDVIDIKFLIQMVFETMAIFKTVEPLYDHLIDLFKNQENVENHPLNNSPDLPDCSAPTKFECIMHLNRAEMDDESCELVNLTFAFLKRINSVRTFFHTKPHLVMLRHLVAHFYGVEINNGFADQLTVKSRVTGELYGLDRSLIYGIGSFFNHSCSPNLMLRVIGNEMVLKTVRSITAGQKLFISYKFFKTETRTVRQSILRENWNFDCRCTRCNMNDITVAEQRRAKNKGKKKVELQRILQDLNKPEDEIDTQDIAYMLEYYSINNRTHEF